MYQLVTAPQGTRLVADTRLTADAFARIARSLATPVLTARKIGRVAARRLDRPQRVETRWNGRETEFDARPGDFLVANLAPDGSPLRDRDGNANVYVIAAETFPTLYGPAIGANEFGAIHPAIGQVRALALPGGFAIVTPWGELQEGASGYLLLSGDEVYGNHRDTFEATYEIVG